MAVDGVAANNLHFDGDGEFVAKRGHFKAVDEAMSGAGVAAQGVEIARPAAEIAGSETHPAALRARIGAGV